MQNVSRETLEMFAEYAELIRKWSPSINLVAKSTLNEVETRHIADSARLHSFMSDNVGIVADLGSGAGLPGIVLAIMAKGQQRNTQFHLIESDQRKAAFLRATQTQLDLPVQVTSDRIENIASLNAELVTARALAPLPKLLSYAHCHLADGGIALLPKGKNHLLEVELAREVWDFDLQILAPDDQSESVVLKITNLKEKRLHE